jgi:hypothetical protein
VRTAEQIRERVMLLLIEEMNCTNLAEPENAIPKFLDASTNKITELILDEITFRKRF